MAKPKAIKPNELIFILLVLAFFIISIIFFNDNNFKHFFDELPLQIIFAILTAIIVAIVFNVYQRIGDLSNNKKFLGYWIVLKWDGEDYSIQCEYVKIDKNKKGDISVLNYYLINWKSRDAVDGIIYIDKRIEKSGELITTYDWLNDKGGMYPTNINRVFYDDYFFRPNDSTPIIRIFNSSSVEVFILAKPKNQLDFLKSVEEKYDEFAFLSASFLSPDFLEKLNKSKDKNKKQ